MLLDEQFLKRLERLRLMVKTQPRGRPGGTHHAPRAGMSLEFTDYKEYSPGDDFRYVDWKVYGRLDRLLIKVFTREQDLPIYLLIDKSSSMEIGGKLLYGLRLAAALGYLGLKELDRVGAYPFASRVEGGLPPHSGPRQIFQLFRYLEGVRPGGRTDLDGALEGFAAQRREPGLLVLLSDMLTPQGYERGLSHLLYRRFTVIILQLLASEDLEPRPQGAVRLEDAEEGGRPFELEMDERAIRAYQELLRAYLQSLEQFCLAHKIEYLRLPVTTPLESAIFEMLGERRVVR
ncbi:MAG: DUF58 domain-containing protein [Candidatus Acetothermia bacterium]|jgi:uncharacterized protein (DUF58 family)|nr:DUF58 domain-containing protein [Candidatus Acetothermia bacterium]MDH7505302.1 DUF58 domain-containing protein [Candidatus Acetothermia bacterium]